MTADGAIKISNAALPRLRTFARVLGSKATLTVAGRSGANLVRSHLRMMNETHPNRMGGRRTNFFSQVSRSVFVEPRGASAVAIAIAHPAIAQKFYGGAITAKRRKYLTIPLIKEAYGKTAQSYEVRAVTQQIKSKRAAIRARGETNAWKLKATGRAGVLFPVRLKSGMLVLAEQTETGIRPVFLLKKRVFQRADPSVLPTEANLTAGIMKSLQDFTDSLV